MVTGHWRQQGIVTDSGQVGSNGQHSTGTAPVASPSYWGILETPQIAWKDISCKFPGRVGSAGQQTAAAAFFATKRQQQHQQQGLLVKPGMAAAKLPDTHQPAEKKKETVS